MRCATARKGQNAITSDLPTTEIPSTPGVLFATIDDLDQVTSLTVLALAPPVGGNPARGGTAISVPITAEAFLSTGEAVNVADAYTTGGVEELQAVTEGLLGVTLSTTIAADEPTIARLLGRATPMQIELPADVLDTTAVGKDLTLFPAGTTELDANDLAALLLARTENDAAADLYTRAAMIWATLATQIGDGLAADGSPVTVDHRARADDERGGDGRRGHERSGDWRLEHRRGRFGPDIGRRRHRRCSIRRPTPTVSSTRSCPARSVRTG